MFSIFRKKKIEENVVANIFVNSILNTIDDGFSEIAGIINDSPEFIISPNISASNDNAFALIIISVNMHYIAENIKGDNQYKLTKLIFKKLSKSFGCNQDELESAIEKYQSFLMKKAKPSRNMRYAISKGIFWKYNLNQYQDTYFKSMSSPNPMFLKRLDDVTDNFIWNWEYFNKKYNFT